MLEFKYGFYLKSFLIHYCLEVNKSNSNTNDKPKMPLFQKLLIIFACIILAIGLILGGGIAQYDDFIYLTGAKWLYKTDLSKMK